MKKIKPVRITKRDAQNMVDLYNNTFSRSYDYGDAAQTVVEKHLPVLLPLYDELCEYLAMLTAGGVISEYAAEKAVSDSVYKAFPQSLLYGDEREAKLGVNLSEEFYRLIQHIVGFFDSWYSSHLENRLR